MPSDPVPLSADEERTWRAFVRLMVMLPRVVDDDLARRTGLGMTRYVVLMRLSEASGRAMRLSDLAEAASISPSRLTRIVQAMAAEGLVTREVVPCDGRAGLATLTDAGLARLRAAWPGHLAGVRSLILDHLDDADQTHLQRISETLLRSIDPTPPTREETSP